MFCEPTNAAKKAYVRRVAWTMSAYLLVIFGVVRFVSRHHPTGLLAYAIAVLPALPIVVLLAVVGIYLRDEKDEFLRWMTVKALLWATGVTLAATTTVGFLENFAEMKPVPGFYVFALYWVVFGAVQGTLQWRNRQGGDD
jgi:hypothetical protein